jgi:hypothetical protein
VASDDFLEFWLVWSPSGMRPPTYRHTTEAAARTEAERLARLRPGAEFFVLRAEAMVAIAEVAWSAARSTYYLEALAPRSVDSDLLALLLSTAPHPAAADARLDALERDHVVERAPRAPDSPDAPDSPGADEDIPF